MNENRGIEMAEKKVELKSMTKKQRWDYIGYYYKNYMLVGIVALVLIGTLIFELVSNEKVIFTLTLCGQGELIPGYTVFEEELTELISPESKKKETARVQLYALENIGESFDDLTALYEQKFLAQVAANELDLVVINEADYDIFYEQGLFEPLETQSQINWEQINEADLVYGAAEQHIYGIKVENNQILESIDYPTQNKMLVMVNNSTRKAESVKIINYLFSEN